MSDEVGGAHPDTATAVTARVKAMLNLLMRPDMKPLLSSKPAKLPGIGVRAVDGDPYSLASPVQPGLANTADALDHAEYRRYASLQPCHNTFSLQQGRVTRIWRGTEHRVGDVPLPAGADDVGDWEDPGTPGGLPDLQGLLSRHPRSSGSDPIGSVAASDTRVAGLGWRQSSPRA